MNKDLNEERTKKKKEKKKKKNTETWKKKKKCIKLDTVTIIPKYTIIKNKCHIVFSGLVSFVNFLCAWCFSNENKCLASSSHLKSF